MVEILLTALATPSSATETTATQKGQWFANRRRGEYLQTPKEDSYSAGGTAGKGWFNEQTWVETSS